MLLVRFISRLRLGAQTSAAIALGLLCTSCVANLDVGSAVDTFRKARPTVTGFDQVVFQKVALGNEVVFTIDQASPILDFGPPVGVSGLKGFELPRTDRAYTLVLRSYLFSDGYPAKAQAFFYPAITLLDDKMQVVRTTDGRDATYILSSLRDEPNDMHRIQVAVPIQPGDTIRYAAIHTYSDQIGTRQQFQGKMAGLTMPLGGGFVSVPGGSGQYTAVGSPVTPPAGLKLRLVAANG